jgi:hypothetical protein
MAQAAAATYRQQAQLSVLSLLALLAQKYKY